MNSKYVIGFISIIVFLFGCSKGSKTETKSQTTLVKTELGNHIDSLLTPYVNKLRILTDNTTGLAIGITKGDDIIYAKTFGFANIETQEAASFKTRFHIASVSKPFTAAAIMKLVQQGKLKLSDSIVKHIPEFTMKSDAYKNITIQHILNHTSGIPRHVSADDWLSPKVGINALEENLENVKNFELDFEPGSQFSYSNSAFDILGVLITRVSGMSFSEYVSKHILEPNGMTESTYNKPLDSLPKHWAKSYSYGLTNQEWQPYPHTDKYLPSSGLQATLLDMCKWGIMHVNNGTYNGQEVLNNAHFNRFVAPTYDTPWGDKIGLSWFLQSYLGRPIIMHTGADTGFESIMYIFPDDNISIVVMANRDFARTGRIINAASEVIFNEKPKDYKVSARYKFSETYKSQGLDKALLLWNEMKTDTTDIYYVNDEDILTVGAILENGKHWKDTKEILSYYTTIDTTSTYAWRLLGNAHLNLQDTINAKKCYEKTLEINPNYEKGKDALMRLKNE